MKKTINRLCVALAAILVSLAAEAYTTTKSETLKVWYEVPTIIADGTTVNYIKVYQHDDGPAYSAFNMHFVFPEGLSVNKVKDGRNMVNDIKFSDRASSTHSISCNMPDATTLKIIGDSSMNDDLFDTDLNDAPLDELFTVGLIASPDMASGSYEIYLEGIKFVYKTGDACVPADEPVYGTMPVDNPATSVEEIEAAELDPDDCYDLMGRRLDPQKSRGKIVVSKGRKFYVK